MVEEVSTSELDKEHLQYINECLNNIDFVEGVDYGQVLRVRRQYQNQRSQVKSSNGSLGNWFKRD
jgi:hypothetical protein